MATTDPIERSVLAARLATLRGEYSSGQALLADLEARAATLREQLLRIQGAAQVLDELLQAAGADAGAGAGASTSATRPAARRNEA
jgi:hypothetical protein